MSTLNHIPIGQRMDNRSRQRARGGRHFFKEAQNILYAGLNDGSPQDFRVVQIAEQPPIQSFELTSANHAVEYLDALFDAAVNRGLEPLIERRKDQTVFRLICSSVDWASVRQTALMK